MPEIHEEPRCRVFNNGDSCLLRGGPEYWLDMEDLYAEALAETRQEEHAAWLTGEPLTESPPDLHGRLLQHDPALVGQYVKAVSSARALTIRERRVMAPAPALADCAVCWENLEDLERIVGAAYPAGAHGSTPPESEEFWAVGLHCLGQLHAQDHNLTLVDFVRNLGIPRTAAGD